MRFGRTKLATLVVAICVGVGFAAPRPDAISHQTPKNIDHTAQPYGYQHCADINYHCEVIPPHSQWSALYPRYRERNMVMRLNRSNVELQYRRWLVVPNKLNKLNLSDLSPFPSKIFPPKEKVIIVNLRLQAFAAYDANGNQIYWGPATGGRPWCPDVKRACETVTGFFRIYKERGPNCFSRTYPVGSGGTPMPYCMFFYQGYAIHGAAVPSLPSTHGCVGVYNNDARWLNTQFVDVGKHGTAVLIFK